MVRLMVIVAWLAIAITPLSAWGVLGSREAKENHWFRFHAQVSVLAGVLLLTAGLCILTPVQRPLRRLPSRILTTCIRLVEVGAIIVAATSNLPALVFMAVEGVTVAISKNPYGHLPPTLQRANLFVERMSVVALGGFLLTIGLLVADDRAARGRFGWFHRLLLAAVMAGLSSLCIFEWRRLPELGLFGEGVQVVAGRLGLVAFGAVAIAGGISWRLASSWPPEGHMARKPIPGWQKFLFVGGFVAIVALIVDVAYLDSRWANRLCLYYFGPVFHNLNFTIPTDLRPDTLKQMPLNLFLWFWVVGGSVAARYAWQHHRGQVPPLPRTRWEGVAWWWIGLSILLLQVLPLLGAALGPAGFVLVVAFS